MSIGRGTFPIKQMISAPIGSKPGSIVSEGERTWCLSWYLKILLRAARSNLLRHRVLPGGDFQM
jgi:hypothetical protein